MEIQVGQLVRQFEAKRADNGTCKAVFTKKEQNDEGKSTSLTEKFNGINYLQENEDNLHEEFIHCQLPVKEPNPRDFLLPCTIGNLKILAAADLGASVNLMSFSLFENLNLTNLKETTMILEMAYTTKSRPRGTIENVLVKVGKFLFPADFVIIDMDQRQHNNLILGRPFLETSHAHIKVLEKQISTRGNNRYFQFK